MSRHVVVVGYGMAGSRLAEEIRRRDPAADRTAVTVIGAEPHPAYNRVLLSAVLGGALRPDAVHLHGATWAGRHHVTLRTGTTVASVDRDRRRVGLADGSTVAYDTLVLATGSAPWLPPTEGLVTEEGLAPGAVAFRTLDDCAACARRSAPPTWCKPSPNAATASPPRSLGNN